jgi:hypothetical protein
LKLLQLIIIIIIIILYWQVQYVCFKGFYFSIVWWILYVTTTKDFPPGDPDFLLIRTTSRPNHPDDRGPGVSYFTGGLKIVGCMAVSEMLYYHGADYEDRRLLFCDAL